MLDSTLMDDYETLVFPKISKAVENTLQNEVAQKCVDLIVESARTNLYGAYTTHALHPYERRESYLHKNEYTTEVNGHTLIISENIHGQGKAENLTEVLEAGTPYEWAKSEIYRKQPFPRPFFGKAIDDGIASGELDTALSNGIASKEF